MEEKKILVVEDEKNIAQVLAYNLRKEGYAVDTAGDGEEGLNKAMSGQYDLILLDIMLPKMDGFEVCRRIRTRSSVPIIFVTAREEEKDKIFGLETGGDDYVTKPFSVKELLSRIRANIRRGRNEMVVEAEKHSTNAIMIGELVIDCSQYSVTKAGAPIELSKKEYDLLVFLAVHAGQAFSRETLLEEVWGYAGFYGDIRTVDVTISRLRDKLGDDKSHLKYILTKRNVGYYLNNFS